MELFKNGISYEEFITTEFEQKLRDIESETSQDATDAYIKLNLQRSRRSARQFTLLPEEQQQLESIAHKQYWMVLTEAWCGDSAQSLPVLAGIAQASPAFELKILLRDANPDIMDRFLTNGNRAIPKLVAFNEHGEELFRWGPRPVEAAQLFKKFKDEGLPKEEIYVHLHKWYAKNKGVAIKEEILNLLKSRV